MTIGDVLSNAAAQFHAAGIPTARLDAEILLAYCLGCERMEFIKRPDRTIEGDDLIRFTKMVARRTEDEPVAYLTRRKEFWGFTLEVSPDVLIPRPDTEVLVEEALEICRREGWGTPRIADIGTGSGAIALALAFQLPHAHIAATDISPNALKLAEINARRLGLQKAMSFHCGDLLTPLDGLWDLIVSNPPYIAAQEYDALPRGVRDYEPKEALWAGENGLEFYENLVAQAPDHLKDKGWLVLEIGASQADAVRGLLEKAGCYNNIGLRCDYAGLPRVVKARAASSFRRCSRPLYFGER